MSMINIDKIKSLHQLPDNIRNICILAHVDHGKTTLADCLLASNGIISSRLAGKVRYLDSRLDEQLRGITMKASSVSLYFKHFDSKEYLINILDSPGHIDFFGEVSSAISLSDCCLIVVDVVEGVCPQTHSLLKQAWKQELHPILVLNKLDRLITELSMTPTDAYRQLQIVLEQVNAIAGELFVSYSMEQHEFGDNENIQLLNELDMNVESKLYFSPEKCNVIFASAIDNWAFTSKQFVDIFFEKLAVKRELLQQTIWGDFYFDSKMKKIRKGAANKGKKLLFIQLVLENVWSVYNAALQSTENVVQLEKIVSVLNIQISKRDWRHNDARVRLKFVMSQWLPLAQCVLANIVNLSPSPKQLTASKCAHVINCSIGHKQKLPSDHLLSTAAADYVSILQQCSNEPHAPIFVYISKMVSVERCYLSTNRQLFASQATIQKDTGNVTLDKNEISIGKKRVTFEKDSKDNSSVSQHNIDLNSDVRNLNQSQQTDHIVDYVFIAFARVFSGRICKGQTLYVLPIYNDYFRSADDCENVEDIRTVTIKNLYIFMGKELISIDEIGAGNIVGIEGLDEHVLKQGTLSSDINAPSLFSLPTNLQSDPIVKVAIEAVNPSDMPSLICGLRLLNQADSSVRLFVQDTGEHVLAVAGELHLQRCVDDLRERFSKIEFTVSEPIIPFQETIILPPKLDMLNEVIGGDNSVGTTNGLFINSQQEVNILSMMNKSKSIEVQTANKKCSFQIRAIPLPLELITFLEENQSTLKKFSQLFKAVSMSLKHDVNQDFSKEIEKFRIGLKEKILECEFFEGWKYISFKIDDLVDRIWSFGPSGARFNLLLNGISSYQRPSIWNWFNSDFNSSKNSRSYDLSVVQGFLLCCLHGPLCEEPIRAVCFVIEDWQSYESVDEIVELNQGNGEIQVTANKDVFGPLSGQIIATVKEGCRLAFQIQPQRLMLAMYICQVQATADVLGKVYTVLGQRGGRVLGEEMKEGSNVFQINAMLPVVESFGFASDIRKRTSGNAWPQLVFSHWEVLDEDPFWTPCTGEELLHYGSKADTENRAKKYMNLVRRRKGLHVDEKVVEFAEKQRTLTKMK